MCENKCNPRIRSTVSFKILLITMKYLLLNTFKNKSSWMERSIFLFTSSIPFYLSLSVRIFKAVGVTDSTKLCSQLLEEAGVAITSGCDFEVRKFDTNHISVLYCIVLYCIVLYCIE